jgi:hypothetical protein
MEDQASKADDLYRALENQHRRQVLFSLLTRERLEVTDEEYDRDSLYLRMVHCHLPLLNDAGFVEWQRERGVVERGTEFENVEPVLQTLQQHHDNERVF